MDFQHHIGSLAVKLANSAGTDQPGNNLWLSFLHYPYRSHYSEEMVIISWKYIFKVYTSGLRFVTIIT